MMCSFEVKSLIGKKIGDFFAEYSCPVEKDDYLNPLSIHIKQKEDFIVLHPSISGSITFSQRSLELTYFKDQDFEFFTFLTPLSIALEKVTEEKDVCIEDIKNEKNCYGDGEVLHIKLNNGVDFTLRFEGDEIFIT